MKNWRRERWRKLYLRESVQQRGLWSVVTRGLRDYVIRIADDDGTLIQVDPAATEDMVLDLFMLAIGTRDAERELVSDAARVLLSDGYLDIEQGRLWVVNLPAAQGDEDDGDDPQGRPLTPAERAKKYRQRRTESRHGERDGASRTVTKPVTATVTNRHETRHGDSVTAVTPASRAYQSDLPNQKTSSQTNQPDKQDPPQRARVTKPVTEARDGQRDASRDGQRDETEDDEPRVRTTKPKQSPLTADNVASLCLDCPGMSADFAKLAVSDWLAEPADPTVELWSHQWRTTAMKVVRSAWRNTRRRREITEALERKTQPGPQLRNTPRGVDLV